MKSYRKTQVTSLFITNSHRSLIHTREHAYRINRLVRFVDNEGQTHYGEAPPQVIDPSDLIGEQVPVFEGGESWNPAFGLSGNAQKIAKVNSVE